MTHTFWVGLRFSLDKEAFVCLKCTESTCSPHLFNNKLNAPPPRSVFWQTKAEPMYVYCGTWAWVITSSLTSMHSVYLALSAPSGALIAIPTYYWSTTHFFRSHRSSVLDFHFLSHYNYIKAIMLYKSHSQMLGKFEYTLPAKFWRLVGCTEMLSW